MSKTYSDQLHKASMLASGLKKNLERVRIHGINAEDLSRLEAIIDEGAKLNSEVEQLRAETKEKVAQANRKLSEIKDTSLNLKRIVKQNFDITHWEEFGVMDKR